ncbi:MAG TPA: porin [Polyangia bacterium]|nr:porin [Polyangia bacterium]
MRSIAVLTFSLMCCTAAAQESAPLAGYANGSFFLRDPHDWFVLFPKGRLQVDWYNFLNRGDAKPTVDPNSSGDPRPKNTLFVRRARAELQGTIFKHFDFHIAGEFASVPGAGAYGTVADAYIVVNYFDFLQLEAGQFDAPFTLENRTSDKYFDFMERSVIVRAFGIPQNKENGAFLFGWLPKRVAYYSLGLANGDGQNFKDQSNGIAVMGRAFIAPLAPFAHGRRWMEDIWAGGSFWYQHDTNEGGVVGSNFANLSGATQNDLAGMSTQGGFGFFSSNYNNGKDTAGNNIREHLAPWGNTYRAAAELNVPIKKLGLRAEYVWQQVDLAAYFDQANATGTTRTIQHGAQLNGQGYYVEVYGWILGDVNFLETPGLEPMPHIKKFAAAPEPKWGLMVAGKYEFLSFDLNGLAANDPGKGNYQIHVAELGVNGWATKHVRLTANYVMNYITSSAGTQAPANLQKNLYYNRAEHELLFRLAIAL